MNDSALLGKLLMIPAILLGFLGLCVFMVISALIYEITLGIAAWVLGFLFGVARGIMGL
jgi:uncharacterized membrane protein required for colicin V production